MKKILFIGNSYTYFYDMPKIFEALATENGYDVQVDAVTKGGRKLYENLLPDDEKHTEILGLCEKNTYDVLFLQEQSYFALVDKTQFENGIKGLIDMVHPKKTVLYSTWGRKEECPLLDTLSLTSDQMTEKLSNAYNDAAKAYGAEISPVGKCFYGIKQKYPDTELYDPDLSHPSYTGSCVAAVCHYKAVFGEMPLLHSALKLDHGVYTKISSVIQDAAAIK